MIRSSKLRSSARDEECTLHIAGVCNYTPSTTVLCHLPDESHGLAQKATDLSACYGCSACHDVIDGRKPHVFLPGERDWYLRRAMVRTWTRFVEKGLVKVL